MHHHRHAERAQAFGDVFAGGVLVGRPRFARQRREARQELLRFVHRDGAPEIGFEPWIFEHDVKAPDVQPRR